MKRFLILSLFVALSFVAFSGSILLQAANATDAPRVTRTMLIAAEQSLDDRIKRLWSDVAFVLPGATRGVYLEGYGVVFTSEVNLANGPAVFMFHPEVTPDEKKQHRLKKLQRVPELKAAMRQCLIAAAASLDTVPDDGQIVFVAMLAKYPWEDLNGLPQQILMQGQKKKLLEAQRNKGAGLDEAIRVVEN